jgi:hypothetical protein
VPYASLWMILTLQTSGLAFDSRVLVRDLGGGLSSVVCRFPLFSLVCGSKSLGIESFRDASLLPKIWAQSIQLFGRSVIGKFGLTRDYARARSLRT